MKSILTWNIQCGLGCDGRFDLARIARVAQAMGDSDVLCFQEVARHDSQYDDGADQVAELQALFPRHEAFFGAAPKVAKGERLRVRVFETAPAMQAAIRAAGGVAPDSGGYYCPVAKTS